MQLSYERNTKASIKGLVSIISASFILNHVLEACRLLMHSFLNNFLMHSYSNVLFSYLTCSNEDLLAHKVSTKNHESFTVLTLSMMSHKEGKR